MTDLKKRTSRLPTFSPSVAATHLISQMRHSDDPLYQCGASLLESHEKMEQHIEWLSHEIVELTRVHNAVVDVAINSATAIKVIQESEVIQSTERKTYKALGLWVVGGISSIATILLNKFVSFWPDK